VVTALRAAQQPAMGFQHSDEISAIHGGYYNHYPPDCSELGYPPSVRSPPCWKSPRPYVHVKPWAWVFFLLFILVSTFTVLNLFIAVVVNAMQETVAADMKAEVDAEAAEAHSERGKISSELRALREAVDRLSAR